MYDAYVVLRRSADAQKQEVFGFIENYRFSCTAACDGFHVYFGTKLKNDRSFKKRYSILNKGLVSYNKRFLAASVNASKRQTSSSHSCIQRYFIQMDVSCRINQLIQEKNMVKFPQLLLEIVDFRDIWLLKCFPDITNGSKDKHFNKKLRSALAVMDNCYDMLKGRWRILSEKLT